jgi:hypothetical protein
MQMWEAGNLLKEKMGSFCLFSQCQSLQNKNKLINYIYIYIYILSKSLPTLGLVWRGAQAAALSSFIGNWGQTWCLDSFALISSKNLLPVCNGFFLLKNSQFVPKKYKFGFFLLQVSWVDDQQHPMSTNLPECLSFEKEIVSRWGHQIR